MFRLLNIEKGKHFHRSFFWPLHPFLVEQNQNVRQQSKNNTVRHAPPRCPHVNGSFKVAFPAYARCKNLLENYRFVLERPMELVHKIKFKSSPSEKRETAIFFWLAGQRNTRKRHFALKIPKINSSRDTVNAYRIYSPWLLLGQLFAHWRKISDPGYQHNELWTGYDRMDFSKQAPMWNRHQRRALPGGRLVGSDIWHFIIIIFLPLVISTSRYLDGTLQGIKIPFWYPLVTDFLSKFGLNIGRDREKSRSQTT